MNFSFTLVATLLTLWMMMMTCTACPDPLEFTHQHLHQQGFHVFTTDTSLSCTQPAGIPSIPVCYVDSLNELMTQAVNILNAAAIDLNRRALVQTEPCEINPYVHDGFQSGNSMSETITNGIELMSEIALNMTIINCHRRARYNESQFNVHQPIRNVICEMRKLMRFARPIEPSKYRASISLEEMDRTDMRTFTCRNLRRAISAITHLKYNINTDFENTQG